MSVGWGQDYDISLSDYKNIRYDNVTYNYLSQDKPFLNILGQLPPCNDGEVELWEECYSIEETTTLWISDNGLSGEIPSEIGELINLTFLSLYNNELTGEIPESIGNLINLSYLDLGYNQLIGEIPESIGNLIYLNDYLYLDHNQLVGSIPESFGNLMYLPNLYLSSNLLSGEIPESIYNLINLGHLSINDNQLTGVISESIGDFTSLITIMLSSNNFSDISGICENNNVQDVRIENLELTEIDDCFGNMSSLFGLFLGENQLYCEDGEQNEDLIPDFLTDGSITLVVGLNQQDCSEESECILGDINNDSSLNILDLVSISNLILDNSYDECGDTNSDGELNILDLVILVNIILDN